jgi:hypothetical protein
MDKKLIINQLQNCADMFEGVILITQNGVKTTESSSIKAITVSALNKLFDVISTLEGKELE